MKFFIIFILSLNSEFNSHKSSQEIFDTLDIELIENYDKFLKEILLTKQIDLENPIIGIYTLYSNKNLLYSYLDLYKQDKQSFNVYAKKLNNNKYVDIRIKNCQESALRA